MVPYDNTKNALYRYRNLTKKSNDNDVSTLWRQHNFPELEQEHEGRIEGGEGGQQAHRGTPVLKSTNIRK